MEMIPLTGAHVREIFERNLSEESKPFPAGIAPADMIKAYLSPGSVAYCVIDKGLVIGAGGIINLQWRRGEAWILHTNLFYKYLKTCMKILKKGIPELAKQYGFRRVQATSFINNEKLFESLGFELESPSMKYYGPSGETARLYVRFFED